MRQEAETIYSPEAHHLHVELESRVRWDRVACAPSAVSEVWWACQSGLLTDLKLGDAEVPAWNDLADADAELKGLAALDTRVKNLAIGQSASVVDLDVGALGNLLAVSFVVLLDIHLAKSVCSQAFFFCGLD